MDDRKIVAWGEGHNSWVMVSPALNFLNVSCQTCLLRMGLFLSLWQVSGVAFDSYWSPPNSDGNGENVYRFGSVGQVCQVYIGSLV
jgi:hypothetical protein